MSVSSPLISVIVTFNLIYVPELAVVVVILNVVSVSPEISE